MLLSPCDLSLERNPETYGRPVKSAIIIHNILMEGISTD